MKRRWFHIFLIVSLIGAAVMLCGYVGVFGVSVWHVSPVAAGGSVYARDMEFRVDDGRFRVMELHGTTTTLSPQIHPGLNVNWHGRFHIPSLRRSIWEFDAHSLPLSSSVPGMKAMLIGCPLWCLLLPSLVAPAIWLRKRAQARRQAQGFPIQPLTAGPGAAAVV